MVDLVISLLGLVTKMLDQVTLTEMQKVELDYHIKLLRKYQPTGVSSTSTSEPGSA